MEKLDLDHQNVKLIQYALRTVMLLYKPVESEVCVPLKHEHLMLITFNQSLANQCLPDKILSFIFRTMKVVLKYELTQQYT